MIEVFTVGGGEYLVNVFNAVASWAGSGGYRGLIRVVMVMAFTWALLVTAWNMDPRALLKWFMQATLMYMVVMVPTISVKVTDRTNPGVTAAVVGLITGTALALLLGSVKSANGALVFCVVLGLLFWSKARWLVPGVILGAAVAGWLGGVASGP